MTSEPDGRLEGTERWQLPIYLTRRRFLRRSGALVATSVVVAGTAGCGSNGWFNDSAEAPMPTAVPVDEQYPAVPPPPATIPTPGELRFFTEEEALTLDSLVATILPGSPEDPGAREAEVVTYIDYLMASTPVGFAQPIYLSGPFAVPADTQGQQAAGTPAATPVGGGAATPIAGSETGPAALHQPETGGTIVVANDQLPRYGYQSPLHPHEIFRQGIARVDQYSRERFGQTLAALSEPEQEAIVEDMSAGKGEKMGFFPPSLQDFFETVRGHVVEGMFSDPAYGGNRDMVGWKLIGYPGIQRAWTPTDIQTPGTRRPPQPLAALPHFHAGQPAGSDHVYLPVSGTDENQPGTESDETP